MLRGGAGEACTLTPQLLPLRPPPPKPFDQRNDIVNEMCTSMWFVILEKRGLHETCIPCIIGYSFLLIPRKLDEPLAVHCMHGQWNLILHANACTNCVGEYKNGCIIHKLFTQVMKLVDTGYRLPPPPGCPRAIYAIMLSCW